MTPFSSGGKGWVKAVPVTPPLPTDALTPGGRVRLARENLCLAMALFAASHQGLITAAFIPARSELHRRNGEILDAYVPLELTDQHSLVRCAGNQIRGAFALSALQTQQELQAAFDAAPPLAEPEPNLRAARVAIYLLARSVGRNLIAPYWDIPADYRRRCAAPDLQFTLDAAALHGQAVRWEHFGGLPRYLDLTLFVSHCLDGADPAAALRSANGDYGVPGNLAGRPAAAVPPRTPFRGPGGYGSGAGRLRRNWEPRSGPEATGWVAPDGPPEPRFSVASQASEPGPVEQFVASACATGSKAMSLAGDLYTSYARWCLDNGYLAHSQRKFGLELRARGYQRKRRGKGRHWWLGVAARPP